MTVVQIKYPYFSILLPTKNRAHLVDFAIRSVLMQSFQDYELIIADNDDSESTKAIVKKFHDERIRYIRTGGLSMVENWNVALDAVSGIHVIVLEDKMIFYPGALESIKTKIKESKSGVVVWNYDVIDDESVSAKLIKKKKKADEVVKTKDILERIISNVMGCYTLLPRGLCCSVPSSTIKEIKKISNRRFYEELSPDFVSAIKILNFVDEYTILGSIFNLVTSSRVSNGKKVRLRQHADHSYFLGRSKIRPHTEFFFLESDLILANLVISDYLMQRRIQRGKLVDYNVTNRHYFEMLFREFSEVTLESRKIIWSKNEVFDLFLKGDGVILNLLYSIIMFWTFAKKRFFISPPGSNAARYKIIHLTSKEEYIEDILNSHEFQ